MGVAVCVSAAGFASVLSRVLSEESCRSVYVLVLSRFTLLTPLTSQSQAVLKGLTLSLSSRGVWKTQSNSFSSKKRSDVLDVGLLPSFPSSTPPSILPGVPSLFSSHSQLHPQKQHVCGILSLLTYSCL